MIVTTGIFVISVRSYAGFTLEGIRSGSPVDPLRIPLKLEHDARVRGSPDRGSPEDPPLVYAGVTL